MAEEKKSTQNLSQPLSLSNLSRKRKNHSPEDKKEDKKEKRQKQESKKNIPYSLPEEESSLIILNEKMPHLMSKFKELKMKGNISNAQGYCLTHPEFLEKLSSIAMAEKIKIDAEQFFEITKDITPRQIATLVRHEFLEKILVLDADGRHSILEQFIKLTKDIATLQGKLFLLCHESTFYKLIDFIVAEKITLKQFIEETTEINDRTCDLLKNEIFFEKSLAFVDATHITLKEFIDKINQFTAIQSVWLERLFTHKTFYEVLLASIIHEQTTLEDFFKVTDNLTAVQRTILKNASFLDTLSILIIKGKTTLANFIERTKEVTWQEMEPIPYETDMDTTMFKCGLYLLCFVANGTVPSIKLNSQQLLGVLWGLSEQQVENNWFGAAHARAAEAGKSYEQYQGLTDLHARGICCGLTREQVQPSSWMFGEEHAKAAEAGKPYEQYQGLTSAQARGICCGLTREQVQPSSWVFGNEHAKAAEKRKPYDQYQGLIEAQAKGICYGLTREQVEFPWFSESHAEAARREVPYEKYKGITADRAKELYDEKIARGRWGGHAMFSGEPKKNDHTPRKVNSPDVTPDVTLESKRQQLG